MVNRRQLMQLAAATPLLASVAPVKAFAAEPQIKVHRTQVISRQPDHYHGWPTLTRRSNGELLVVCSGGRKAHVCPFGRVELIRSSDNGKTWSWPRVLLDGAIDDRDAGVLETAKGSLLVTTFTSNAYESSLKKHPDWLPVHRRLPAAARKKELGTWMIRSTDGGVTWSARYDCQVNSPHGPVQLADGRLLYAGRNLWRSETRIGVCQSEDDGQTWQWLADIPAREGDTLANYHELHAVQAADGSIIVHIRNHNTRHNRETLQTTSTDGGKTWSTPKSIGVWGLPSHLIKLSDDRLLMSYGHRRKPYGIQARLSEDHGKTWSAPMILTADGAGGDLGYPSTVELEDRSLVTVWYERLTGKPMAVLRMAHWSLHGK